MNDLQDRMMHKEIIERLDRICALLGDLKDSLGPVANLRAMPRYPPLEKLADAISSKPIRPEAT